MIERARDGHAGAPRARALPRNPAFSQWARQASNLGPTGYEPAALTN